MISALMAVLASFRSLFRSKASLQAEVFALRHQLLVLQRQRGGGGEPIFGPAPAENALAPSDPPPPRCPVPQHAAVNDGEHEVLLGHAAEGTASGAADR